MRISTGHDSASETLVPLAPHGLTVDGDHAGLTLTWQQRGDVDGWTVYCDFLDGSENETVYVPRHPNRPPTHRFGDLGPGDHHVGVVSWRDGRHNVGEGCWAYGCVLPLAPEQPGIPVVTRVAVAGDTLVASWISQDAARWHLRLLGSDHSPCQEHDIAGRPQAVVTMPVPYARYGVQVQAIGDNGALSPWSEPAWVRCDPTPRLGLLSGVNSDPEVRGTQHEKGPE
jgi:hypothetical protein